MREATEEKLINLAAAALGAGVAAIGLHYKNDMIMMAGASAFGAAAMKQPGGMLKRKKPPMFPKSPTPPPVPLSEVK